jgi:sugar/nucleoside kinase (ribokinase family)
MTKILTAGLINIETTLRVDSFPLQYQPVHYPFFGISTTVSGVGYNIASALTRLGDPVVFFSIIGRDMSASLVRDSLSARSVMTTFVIELLEQTPQSVILYDKTGKRQIHVDLKDIQEQTYPQELFNLMIQECAAAVLCNINFTRPFLSAARQAGKLIATDVHALSELEDPYNRDYMEAADILFMSDELLPCPPEEWSRMVMSRYPAKVLVIGMGARGALLSLRADQTCEHIPAVDTRPVVNSIGAGDALFSCFLHYYLKNDDPRLAIRKAVRYASYKIGTASAADGFLTEEELEKLN